MNGICSLTTILRRVMSLTIGSATLQNLHDAWNAELVPPLWSNPKAAVKKAAKREAK